LILSRCRRERELEPSASVDDATTRIVRVIARLNVGGPSIQAISMTRMLEERGYRTTLVRGSEGPGEGSMDDLADRLGVRPRLVRSMRREPGIGDIRALLRLMAIMTRERPAIVHTHAAKAGALGRIAALTAPGWRGRLLVHTFHGHSLSGYFPSRSARAYRLVERMLAKRTHCLVAVSQEVRDELVALGVAPAERFEVIHLGFDLSAFLVDGPERARRALAWRERQSLPPQAPLVTLVARLAPIKRVDRFLRIAARLGAEREDVRFLVVGDGELRTALTAQARELGLAERVTWTGFRKDIPDVCFASDVVVLTSDNEGTPVSLIEALAAGTPVVSAKVGGVATVVLHERTGLVVEPQDEHGFAQAVRRLLEDRPLAQRLAEQGRRHTLETFQQQRLVDDLDGLYRRLLTASGQSPPFKPSPA
jgi:glycosyltransferase involved in cell wall biosynthesis